MTEDKTKNLGFSFPCKVDYEVWLEDKLVEKDSWKACMPNPDWAWTVQRAYDLVFEELDRKYSRKRDPRFWFKIYASLMWTTSCPMAKV